MTKQEWRRYIKQKLVAIPDDIYKSLSTKITNRLFQDKGWLSAETVGITFAKQREIETRQVMIEGWKCGKRIAVPKCDPLSRKMTFYVIQSFDQIESGYCHLIEPIPAKTETIASELIDMLIVPGLVFDLAGFRIGYGGGYYDRYLADYPHITISLALEMQVVKKVPHEAFDVPIQRLITEKMTYQFE